LRTKTGKKVNSGKLAIEGIVNPAEFPLCGISMYWSSHYCYLPVGQLYYTTVVLYRLSKTKT